MNELPRFLSVAMGIMFTIDSNGVNKQFSHNYYIAISKKSLKFELMIFLFHKLIRIDS